MKLWNNFFLHEDHIERMRRVKTLHFDTTITKKSLFIMNYQKKVCVKVEEKKIVRRFGSNLIIMFFRGFFYYEIIINFKFSNTWKQFFFREIKMSYYIIYFKNTSFQNFKCVYMFIRLSIMAATLSKYLSKNW